MPNPPFGFANCQCSLHKATAFGVFLFNYMRASSYQFTVSEQSVEIKQKVGACDFSLCHLETPKHNSMRSVPAQSISSALRAKEGSENQRRLHRDMRFEMLKGRERGGC
jgi:hypothetical protein